MTARALTARPARFLLGAGSTAVALAIGGAPLLLTVNAHAAEDIVICHATGSHQGPYITNSPSKTADAGGHDDHGYTKKDHLLLPVYYVGIEGEWGDIIPPFDYPASNQEPAGHYPGLNWTAEGQAIYNTINAKGDRCNLPTGGGSTGGTTGVTTGETTGVTTGETTGVTTGETTGVTTGETTGVTTGETTGETTGVTTGETTGDTTGETTGATTGETTGATTGGASGETTGTVEETPTTPVTGGGGTVTQTPTRPITGGGGTVNTAAELPFTGDRTSTLALWGFASLLGGIGFTALGQRQGKHAR